ncbi:AdoMet_MTases domain containing protein [uncultured Caudovirales phage]|uniref:AdoMet_MTases domain containing protein n=1 Tax=uncultured Caudovirales phage TaxID=2100421 RepID=A0A6J5N3W7_9CAUD|nr:AdoMet_MTases domain containing protein [uncultured Caudovirales phage]
MTNLMLGDNIESLKKLEENSVDSVVTDPPYGLSFMNKKWDHDVPSVEFWKEVYRVLKPGGHVLSFGGTRTYHRMTVNIEDAGFEIRDQIMWLYGSGFPKSHNIGKSVDKMRGNDREVVGIKTDGAYSPGTNNLGINRASLLGQGDGRKTKPTRGEDFGKITKGTSEWEGWGTALKPANEPICVARKPLSEKTIAENVLRWGTGGINIDGCRVGTETIMTNMKNTKGGLYNLGNEDRTNEVENTFNEGRFPANIILDEEAGAALNEQSGISKSQGPLQYDFDKAPNQDNQTKITKNIKSGVHFSDKGGAARFFYCAKDSEAEKVEGRFPANIILDEEAGAALDEQSGMVGNNWKKNYGTTDYNGKQYDSSTNQCSFGGGYNGNNTYADKGGASRFFYCAKVSKKERNMGLEGFEAKQPEGLGHGLDRICSICETPQLKPCDCEDNKWVLKAKKNTHPTVKPISLMAYLCRLITPPNGIVLDPFMGSGSTGIAANLEGFNFIGMEMDEDYFKIAETRVESYEKYRELKK